MAKGDYIWIAESDDYCKRIFLINLIERLENDELKKIFIKQKLDIQRQLSVYLNTSRSFSFMKLVVGIEHYSLDCFNLKMLKKYLKGFKLYIKSW